ncbi:glucosamine-6-phosphate deaminase [Limosilactobacillus pontis]|uniref:Glucosamine-6-phosphate deaminase n=1 Tax=Limosilactobacillus pontis TaxID=35787 RepID=A0ABT7UYE5_9LACO|nr:glucosamine-6-phosphate deaminase [Limosilactobacillus pontis]MDM8266727.1 glucosamine-6-phosphate deaminase [Limosilactobacillus pontis]
MKIITAKTATEASARAFDIVNELMRRDQLQVMGLATGSTPLDLYKQICESNLDFSRCTSVNLDEYVGLKPTDPQSYHYFMQEHLFNAKPFKESFFPDGTNPDAGEVTRKYDRILAQHPIDLQILGIGRNGHIGFNEPGTLFDSHTHRVALTASTINANARFFENPDEVPRYAYTMGIASIMAAKRIILLAFGDAKAEAIRQTVNGPVTLEVPGSVLQRHPDVTVVLDEAAAGRL